jgi:hypothetical protein
MDQTQILNEQLLFKAKEYIADTLVKASNDRYFHHGVDTNQLTKIYNDLDINNVNTLYNEAQHIVDLHLNMRHREFNMTSLKGGAIVFATGMCIVGVGYFGSRLLNYFGYQVNTDNIMSVGGCIAFGGFCIMGATGH